MPPRRATATAARLEPTMVSDAPFFASSSLLRQRRCDILVAQPRAHADIIDLYVYGARLRGFAGAQEAAGCAALMIAMMLISRPCAHQRLLVTRREFADTDNSLMSTDCDIDLLRANSAPPRRGGNSEEID